MTREDEEFGVLKKCSGKWWERKAAAAGADVIGLLCLLKVCDCGCVLWWSGCGCGEG